MDEKTSQRIDVLEKEVADLKQLINQLLNQDIENKIEPTVRKVLENLTWKMLEKN